MSTYQMIRIDKLNKPEPSTRTFASRSQPALDESVGALGVLNPLLVRALGDGEYALIAGERRLTAVLAGGAGPATEVPCLVVDLDDRQAMLVALTDNVVREALSAWDEARLAQMLVADYALDRGSVGRALGRSASWVSERLAVFDLAPEVLAAVRSGEATMEQARALLPLRGRPEEQRELLAQALAQGHEAAWIAAEITARESGGHALRPQQLEVDNAGTIAVRTTRSGKLRIVLEAEHKSGLKKLLSEARKRYAT